MARCGKRRDGMTDGARATRLRAGPTPRQMLREALVSVRPLSQRSLLTMLGITVGSAAIVALLNLGRGAADESLRSFETMGANTLIVNFAAPVGGRPAPATFDGAAALAALPALTRVAPIALHATRVGHAGRGADATVVGADAALAAAANMRLRQGRFVSDFDQRAGYAVLGAGLARALGLERAPPGATIRIEHYLYTVIGVLDALPPNPLLPIAFDDAVIVPLAGMRRLQPVPQLNSLIVSANDADHDTTQTALKRYLARALPGVTTEVQLPVRLIDGMRRQARTFAYLLAALGGVALLVSGIGVMNVMLMSVAERRREIGVRLALGARQRDIRNMFLLEAAGLSLGGALAGALLGVGVTYGFTRLAHWSFRLNADALLIGVASPLLVGLVFGLFPAMAAARLQPLQILRDD